ncbi:MAG: hypothetical protein HYU42_15920 [Candidatus Rokubacteria bacterium]|nr:hypothetical protein [Candidatus Rokubacteria bacterium]MBI3107959.1 hypothetical protein [Candidatus Rokubacteria bacterium]
MSIPRYAIHDAYVVAELRSQYEAADVQGRITLLEGLYRSPEYRDDRLPYELALLAVSDPSVEVRRWIARNARHLDYRERETLAPEVYLFPDRLKVLDIASEFVSQPAGYRLPDRNLLVRLKDDPEPVVRASLRENPCILGPLSLPDDSLRWFRDSSHSERLALVRNAEVHPGLILQLFDPEDRQLGIELPERCELCWAFLTNRAMIERIVKGAGLKGHPMPLHGSTFYEANRFLTSLWGRAVRWPDNYLQMAVYRHVPADDRAKATTYRACRLSPLRAQIVCACDPDDHAETLDVARRDSDDECRELAYARIGTLNEDEIESLVAGNDVAALKGLADNRSLPAPVRASIHQRARQQLREIGEDTELYEDRDLDIMATEPECSDGFGSRLERLAEKLEEIDQGVAGVKRCLDRLEERSGVIERSVDRLERLPERLDRTDDALQAMRSTVEGLSARLSFPQLAVFGVIVAIVVTLMIRWWR